MHVSRGTGAKSRWSHFAGKSYASAGIPSEAIWVVGALTALFGILVASSTVRDFFFSRSIGQFESVSLAISSGSWLIGWCLVSGLVIFGYVRVPRLRSTTWSVFAIFVMTVLGGSVLIYASRLVESPNIEELIWRSNLGVSRDFLPALAALFFALLAVVARKGYLFLVPRFSQAKVSAVGLGFILVSFYFLLASIFLPEGVNLRFVSESWIILLSAGLLTLAGASRFIMPPVRYPSPGGGENRFRLRISDTIYIVFPLIPVVRYTVLNLEYLDGLRSLTFVLVALGLTLVFILMVPLALGRASDPGILMAMSSAAAYVIFNMASLSSSRGYYETGNLLEQLSVLAVLMSAVLLFSQIRREVFVVAVLVYGMLEIGESFSRADETENVEMTNQAVLAEPGWVSTVRQGSWESNPNVYILVYESYANEETLHSYGIDNSSQMEFLLSSGFTIYDGVYSTSAGSIATMSKVLEMSEEVSKPPRSVTSGESLVSSIFENRGYETYGIFFSDYFSTGFAPTYTYNFPVPRASISLLEPFFRGEFRFEDSYTEADYESYLREKREVVTGGGQASRFMYSHNAFPGHSQNSGSCWPERETQNYANGLEIANEEMRLDLVVIPDLDDAIIILAGDHGPFLTKNCSGLADYPLENITRLDIQDRYGTFLAVRWPGGEVEPFQIELLQDIFPAVFSYLAGRDEFIEGSRVAPRTSGVAAGAARVTGGIIRGGADDGEPLFLQKGPRITK